MKQYKITNKDLLKALLQKKEKCESCYGTGHADYGGRIGFCLDCNGTGEIDYRPTHILLPAFKYERNHSGHIDLINPSILKDKDCPFEVGEEVEIIFKGNLELLPMTRLQGKEKEGTAPICTVKIKSKENIEIKKNESEWLMYEIMSSLLKINYYHSEREIVCKSLAIYSSPEDMFQQLDKEYDLSEPKKFWLCEVEYK